MEYQDAAVRRVYRGELARRLGCSPEWTRQLERAGKIPPAKKDDGSRRPYWLSPEADRIVAGRQPEAA